MSTTSRTQFVFSLVLLLMFITVASAQIPTHDAGVGIEAGDVKAAFGYAGRSNKFSAYPSEAGRDQCSGILLSVGYAFCAPEDRSPEAMYANAYDGKYTNPSLWSAEADFYVKGKSAVIAALSYGRMTRQAGGWIDETYGMRFPSEEHLETLSLESGFRYQSSENSDPFFIQASVGIVRFNLISDPDYSRHAYVAVTNASASRIITLNDAGLILMPKLGIRVVVMGQNSWGDKLEAYPQFVIGMNVGYML
jgi:hypothetical protein